MAEILIVQDEPIFNELICESFAREGYEAISVRSTEEAMQFLEVVKPSLIITDETKLLEKYASQVLPCAIVIISKSDETPKIAKALKLGALDFSVRSNLLDKTFAWVEIGNRIKDLSVSNDSKKQRRLINMFRTQCSAFQEAI